MRRPAFALLALAPLLAAGAMAGAMAGTSPTVATATGGGGAAAAPALTMSRADYRTPDVRMIRADGREIALRAELDDGRPVVMNFIFTSCGAICPLMSQTFGQFQAKLGAHGSAVHLVSISIDPEEDTPERLLEYAAKFHARSGWNHYTGTLAASVAAQRAFGVYRGDKMGHGAVTLMRAAPGQPWLRIDGFATPDDLLREYRALTAPP